MSSQYGREGRDVSSQYGREGGGGGGGGEAASRTRRSAPSPPGDTCMFTSTPDISFPSCPRRAVNFSRLFSRSFSEGRPSRRGAPCRTTSRSPPVKPPPPPPHRRPSLIYVPISNTYFPIRNTCLPIGSLNGSSGREPTGAWGDSTGAPRPAAARSAGREGLRVQFWRRGCLSSITDTPPPPPPSPPRTKWTRRVPHPVLIGHAASHPRKSDLSEF